MKNIQDFTLGEILEILEKVAELQPQPIVVGGLFDGDIIYKIDAEFAYLVAPASKRFFTDWYDAEERCGAEGYKLPSKEELIQIRNLRFDIDAADSSGGIYTLARFVSNNSNVWSSAEVGSARAWILFFNYGSLDDSTKGRCYFVVPVKKIKLEDLNLAHLKSVCQ